MRRAHISFLERDAVIERLARKFYALQGCEVPDDYRMQSATHPQERLCVAMAIEAINELAGK